MLGIVLAAAVTTAPEGMIRHYLFDEGAGDEVVNHVTVRPGKRAISGGPLGSLTITYRTHYGIASEESYTDQLKDTVETDWCEGRYPGKSALRVGQRPVGLYRSGITGGEFTNGMTVCGWIKFEGEGEKRHVTSFPLRLGTGTCENGFILRWEQAQWNPKGRLTFTVGLPRENGKSRGEGVSLADCEPDVWHAFALLRDARGIRLWLDGRGAEKELPGAIVVPGGAGSWSGLKPFVGGTRVNCLHIGNREGQGDPMPFALDELAIFDRALSADELKAFLLAKPAAGTADEQRAATAAERTKREALAKIVMKIPEDSNGYFRLGEKIPVTLEGAPSGAKLRLRLETTYGRKVFDRTVEASTAFALDACDAYRLDMSLLGADGKVVKTLRRPYLIGIVPKAPDHLNSPFGWWAMTDDFGYDSNLRRTDIPMWGGNIYTNVYLAKHNRHLGAQKIRKEDLREYGFLPYDCGLKLPQGHKLTAEEKEHVRRAYKAVVDVSAEYGMKEFEVTSEVDGHTTPDIYIQLLDLTKEALDAKFGSGNYRLYPPGATPCALPFINKILELGAEKYVDGVSHHNYLSNPVYNFYWDNPGKRLAKIVDARSKACGRKLEMFNTESGIFTLPYVHDRPMTREHARSALYSISQIGGYETYNTSMPTLPDDEAAAVQVHAVLVNLASGYKMYVKCQTPCLNGALPCRQGVALTTLSGQVLNDMTAIRALPMSSLKTMAVLVDREHKYTKAKSNCLAVFGMEEKPFTFKVAPNATYRTMDLLGNAGTMKADANGVLRIVSRLEPVYVFDVPADVAELTPMRLEIPKELPEGGIMDGKVVLENPFGTALAGELKADPLRGAEIELGQTSVTVAPGGRLEVPFRLKATGLKRRNYPVRVVLGTLVAEAAFASNGLTYVIPRVTKPFALDGDARKWDGVPEMVCDTEDDVVHGKPNFAEQWLPQWQNRTDLSLVVRTCYVRDDALYFRLDVTDQAVRPAKGEEIPLAFCFDCLELFVDTRTGQALGSPVDFGADQVIVPAVDSAALGKSPLWYAKRDDRHVEVETVGRRTEKGWMLEGRIVPNAKSALRLRPGSRLMMDFVVDDCDEDSRRRKAAMAVHGTFDNNSNVAGWGRYELGL